MRTRLSGLISACLGYMWSQIVGDMLGFWEIGVRTFLSLFMLVIGYLCCWFIISSSETRITGWFVTCPAVNPNAGGRSGND